ncbi:MAG: hypothetical protein IJL06_10055 [Kiritimatiellae bacterium]|nr:hypothetical protein [Kiritimatiellia bacterium]
MKRLAAFAVLVAALLARGETGSPLAMCAALEARMAAGDGVTLPDADAELVRHAGTVDVAHGDWPEAFAARAGETVCVAVSPFTGCYEFFDESGECFYTLVPVLATTENWVAPFRHAEEGPFPDDDLYAPWRLVDVWQLSHAESAEFAETSGGASSPREPRRLETHAENAESLVTRGVCGPATNLSFTAFAFSETNLFFTAAWPTNEALPQSVLDLYGSSNLSSRAWLFLSSHPATNPPVDFSVDRSSLPWIVDPALHVHDGSCESITNVVLSPLDGSTVYTNVFWSCSTNRVPGDVAFFTLGTRHDTDGDGLFDALELLAFGTDPDVADTGDAPVGVDPDVWALSHPTWATNYADADLAIGWYPLPSFRWGVYRIGNLFISLADSTAPKYVRLPPGVSVPCSVSADGLVYFTYWSGSRHVEYAPGLDDPPLWYRNFSAVLDPPRPPGPAEVAVPLLTVEPMLGSETTDRHVATNGSVCIHGGSPVQRFVWSVAPADIAIGRTPFATGDVRIDGEGPFVDLSGATGPRTGGFGFAAGSTAGGGYLAGVLTNAISAHLCDASPTNPLCSVCGCEDSQTNALIFISQDYRYALFGTTNMSRFAATVQNGGTNDIVWTVAPDLPDGVWLHASDDPESVGEGEIAGAAQVWADSGFCTNQFTITASFTFAPSQSVSKTFTTVAIDAEPICTETDTSGFVVNPCMVPTGETATFRIKVFPSSVPDSHIYWNLSGGHAQFVGSRYGREVRIQGTNEGPVHLEVVLDGYQGINPTFDTYVADIVAIPVDAWIVIGNGGNPVVSADHVQLLIADANSIFRQICISCYVHRVSYTNNANWVVLPNYGTTEFSSLFNEIVSVPNDASGLEVHFVQTLPNVSGVNSPSGMVLDATSSAETFAHETGHAMGLDDIYWMRNTPYQQIVVTNRGNISLCQDDWSGSDARGFYKPRYLHANLIRRHIMCGEGNLGRRDYSRGDVYGIRRTSGNPLLYEFDWSEVGMYPEFGRRLPSHE